MSPNVASFEICKQSCVDARGRTLGELAAFAQDAAELVRLVAARAVAREGRACVRRMLPLSLTFDHRAVTGGEAARFLAALIEDLQRAE